MVFCYPSVVSLDHVVAYEYCWRHFRCFAVGFCGLVEEFCVLLAFAYVESFQVQLWVVLFQFCHEWGYLLAVGAAYLPEEVHSYCL